MSNFSFSWFKGDLETKLLIQSPVTDQKYSFSENLFSTARHLNFQSSGPYFSFYLFEKRKPEAVAAIHFTELSPYCFQSLARAPFGGIACAEPCSSEALDFFISCIQEGLLRHKARQITIKTEPSCYNVMHHRLLDLAYRDAGFRVISEEVNLHIPVTDKTFREVINRFERKKLHLCKKAGFETGGGLHTPEEVYEFVRKSAADKNYPLSLTASQFQDLCYHFPDNFLIFMAKEKKEILAVCATVRVTEKILYLFLPADALAYRKFSPMVLLYEAIFHYAQTAGIELLDLGISLDHAGNEKPGLIRFKKNLGGQESVKITYQKQLY